MSNPIVSLLSLALSGVSIVVMVTLSQRKGFNPALWAVTGGLPGIVACCLLPSARSEAISPELAARRRRWGNVAGSILTVLSVLSLVGRLASQA